MPARHSQAPVVHANMPTALIRARTRPNPPARSIVPCVAYRNSLSQTQAGDEGQDVLRDEPRRTERRRQLAAADQPHPPVALGGDLPHYLRRCRRREPHLRPRRHEFAPRHHPARLAGMGPFPEGQRLLVRPAPFDERIHRPVELTVALVLVTTLVGRKPLHSRRRAAR